jgi:hypothetical protein
MNKTTFRFAFLSIFVLLAGCGTEEYESRLDRGVSTQNSGSKFTALNAQATAIPGTKVSLQLPPAMQSTDINDAARGKLPKKFFEIPNLKATYEGFVEDKDKNKLYYDLYVGVGEGTPNTLRSWMNIMRQNFPNAEDSSTEVNTNYSVGTPEGGSLQWDEIHFKASQPFYYTKPDNSLINQELPGTMICLSHTEKNVQVTLILRYADSLGDRHYTDFDSNWLKLIAGSVKIAD